MGNGLRGCHLLVATTFPPRSLRTDPPKALLNGLFPGTNALAIPLRNGDEP